MARSLIWVFGNAVQDVTVEVEIDTLIRDNAALIDSIALRDTILIREGSLFTTYFSGKGLGVKMDLEKVPFAADEPQAKSLYALSPGEKYTLKGRVEELADRAEWLKAPNAMMVHCEDVSWGGGGINVCRFLRALAPSDGTLQIQYTDYAMSRTFDRMIRKLEAELRHSLSPTERRTVGLDEIGDRVGQLMDENMYEGERLISKISNIFALYSPERCLEVFLASLLIRPFLFRPKEPVYQRNWVFSNFRSGMRSTQDKIICRSKTPTEAELNVTEQALDEFLEKGESDAAGAIVLNSIKHPQMFRSAYSLYRRIEKQRSEEGREDFVGILAMTKAMQAFIPDMLEIADKEDDKCFPPFILIFNETEAVDFAQALPRKKKKPLEPIIRAAGDLPNVFHFAQIVEAIRPRFGAAHPRIYVTTGPRGSLGWDGESNKIIHVSFYSRLGDILFDTNACGDAYCAAVTLLEWRKRCYKGKIGPEDPADEMRHFMAVATAAAYCKARDRRGRIDSRTIRSLLEDTYLGSAEVGLLGPVLQKKWPNWIDSEGRAHRPPTADFRRLEPALAELLLTKVNAAALPAQP